MEVIAKWNGKEYTLAVAPEHTIYDLKRQLEEMTKVQPKRQKLMGLGKILADDELIAACNLKPRHKIIMMGTPEQDILLFNEPPPNVEVYDDFDMLVTPTMKDFKRDSDNRAKLRKVIEACNIHVIHPPRPNKKLLVLDLDYTILDCKNISEKDSLHEYKRPHLDAFMASCYQDYDIVIWSQTHWRWVEVKLTEMGLLTHPDFRITFVLDRTLMFPVSSHKHKREHEVKALEIIWTKFPHWNKTNSIHIDDLSRNFVMNPKNGLKITPFKNAMETRATDEVLPRLARYLKHIAEHPDLCSFDHSDWEKTYQDKKL